IHRRIDLNELYDADELVVLSSSKLIKRADTLDGKAVGMKDAATYLKIQNAYFDYVKEETGHWMGE
ncbi:MAG: hypothetical protein IKR11_04400, partial [Solobacterium sp.]|nr:hypothetical protein [Solobacterium sp.]